MIDIESLWDFSEPGDTELVFRSHLVGSDDQTRAVLWTQIARTYSLRGMFDEGRDALCSVERSFPEARVRYELELGRIFNSSGHPQQAVPHFLSARELATEFQMQNLQLDAIHMLAIADVPGALGWAEEGIAIAMNAQDEKCRRWLGPLYNNLGWTYFDLGEYEKALEFFELGLEERERQGIARPIEIAKEAIAEAKRALANDGS
ncbi:MAG: tetratricopeptide repeat protein [Fimbriimonadaceae bacterium]|nr:tetratricopeptide repeat protein [Fimbriimonadaceae bacterium]